MADVDERVGQRLQRRIQRGARATAASSGRRSAATHPVPATAPRARRWRTARQAAAGRVSAGAAAARTPGSPSQNVARRGRQRIAPGRSRQVAVRGARARDQALRRAPFGS